MQRMRKQIGELVDVDMVWWLVCWCWGSVGRAGGLGMMNKKSRHEVGRLFQ